MILINQGNDRVWWIRNRELMKPTIKSERMGRRKGEKPARRKRERERKKRSNFSDYRSRLISWLSLMIVTLLNKDLLLDDDVHRLQATSTSGGTKINFDVGPVLPSFFIMLPEWSPGIAKSLHDFRQSTESTNEQVRVTKGSYINFCDTPCIRYTFEVTLVTLVRASRFFSLPPGFFSSSSSSSSSSLSSSSFSPFSFSIFSFSSSSSAAAAAPPPPPPPSSSSSPTSSSSSPCTRV